MKQASLIVLLTFIHFAGHAALSGKCTPSAAGTGFSGTTTYCAGAAATALTYNYAECASGSGAATGVACTATWYYNTTNTTNISGATVTVSGPTAFTSAAGVNGNLPTVTPVTTTAGTYYYFCVVTWTVTATCTSPFTTATQAITINPTPNAIAGVKTVCVGSAITLSDPLTGGTWSSSVTTDATIGSATGVVTGVAGTTSPTITYKTAAGCSATVVITVDALPAAITGTTSVCTGLTTTLADGTAGGTWSSSNTAIATIGSTKIATGVSAGTATISYTLATGCYKTTTLTVNQTPAAISSANSVCVGSTISLSDAVTGGTWSSSATVDATIGSATGILTGVTGVSTPTITYLLATGCKTTKIITVNALPGAITGTATVCVGLTTTLADVTAGGTWSSSNTAIATIGTAHIATGVSAGTAIITYTLATGCLKTTTVTVNPNPTSINGTFAICASATTTLTDATGSGAWSLSNSNPATINAASGLVTASGVNAGTTTVSYTVKGCSATQVFTVNALPTAIQGVATECQGLTVAISDAAVGGTWSSSGDISVASSGSNSAIVTGGSSAGTGTITYTLADGCKITSVNTVKADPTAINGVLNTCIGATTTLSDATSGVQSWTSSNTAVATNSGVHVTGVSGGTTTITYTLTSGCYTTAIVTVIANPAAISGANTLCSNGNLTLSDPATSSLWTSNWSSSNTIIATVGAATGIITGASNGTTVITFSTGCGTNTTKVVTVNPAPASINGNNSICAGLTTGLSDITTGGTWASSNTNIAVIASTGVVTGVAGGNVIISYTIPSGCFVTNTEIINNLPTAVSVTGGGTACNGSTLNASNGGSGTIYFQGTTSNGTSTATQATSEFVSTSGVYYFNARSAAGCWSAQGSATVTSTSLSSIANSSALCIGNTITLTDAATGGTWSSSNTEIVTIGSDNGAVSAITEGSATITYSLGGICYTTAPISVNSAPTVSTGTVSAIIKGMTSTPLHFYTTGAPTNYNIAWCSSAHTAGFSDVTASPLDTLLQDTVLHLSIPSNAIAATYTGTLTVSSTGCISRGAAIAAVISDSLNIYTFAGTGINGFSGDNGAATLSKMSNPSSVASDCNGNTYIADYGNGVVRKVDARGVITTFAGNGTIGYSGDNGPATAAELSNPTGVAIDGNGNVYISDYSNMVIRMVNTSGVITTFAGNGGHGYSGDNGPATSAELNYPVGLAVDNANNVYITDYLNSAIRMVNAEGIITTVAGNGIAGYTGDGGQANNAQLNYPRGVAVDGSGNIYIADYSNNVIRKVNASGIISTFAGVGIEGYSGDGGEAVLAKLNNPWGIAVDGHNNVYFSELHNNVIRKVDSTGIIITIGGMLCGCEGYSGDGGMAIYGKLDQPMGISINCSGNLYIADNANFAIRVLGTYNRVPFFAQTTQNINAYQSSPSTSLNSILAVTDFDTLQHETWSIASNASNGTLSVSYSTTSTGSTLTPSGLTYTPAPGYTGLDSFTVQVSDGTATATTTVYVTVSEAAGRMSNLSGADSNNTVASNISLQVFPNPSRGNFNIKTSGAGTFYLFSMEGQSVGEYTVTDQQTEVTMPSGLPSGIYIGRFKNTDGNTTDVKMVYEQ